MRLAYHAGREVSAGRFGFGEPLPLTGVPLSKDGGVWSATVCLPPARMLYAYRLLMQPDDADAGLVPLTSHDPNVASVVSAEYGLLNELDARDAGTCALFPAGHADTSRPDAGALEYPDGGVPGPGGGGDGGASADGGP